MRKDSATQLRREFAVTSGATPPSGNPEFWNGEILWVTPEDLSARKSYWLEDTRRKISHAGYKSCGTNLVPSHSIILSKRAPIGLLAVLKRTACSNQGCFLLTPTDDADTRFYYYWLFSKTEYLRVLGRGSTFMEISADDLKSIRLPTPLLHVQRSIADYLDRETAMLDALVGEKKLVLDLLAEKRRTLITRAVTRGLENDVPLRDSGIPWLGEIPAHWETQKFTRIVKIIEGQVDPESAPFVHWPLIAPNHVESETGRLIYRETAAEQGAMSGKYRCRAYDVIYSKIRPALRKATLAAQDSLRSADMYPLRTGQSLQPEYLLYLVLSEPFSVWATLESTRVAMPKINREALGNIKIPVPPYHEQEAIVRFIKSNVSRIDELRNVTTNMIGLLRERRSAIIEEAVSGQVDAEQLRC